MSKHPVEPKESVWTRTYQVGSMVFCPAFDLAILAMLGMAVLIVALIQIYWEYLMLGCLLYIAIGAAVSGGGFLVTGLASYLFVSLFRKDD